MSSQRVSGRKKRKLHIDDSDEISLSRNLDLCIGSDFKKVKDSQTLSEGHIDLFGELIPPDVVSNVDTKNKSTKKTPVSKKKKQPYEEIFVDTPTTRPKRVYIPTTKIMKLMKEAHTELYPMMGVKTSSSNVSIVSTDSLNVSGVQHLQDSPITCKKNESIINTENIRNDKKPQKVLEGVVAFVDYKIDNDRVTSISEGLMELGAKVVKTFSQKVTHVMFCDGYRSTYNKAIERNIPLVSARWMEYSKQKNKIQDPADYPPVGLDKYTKTPLKVYNINKHTSWKKFLSPSSIERDQIFKRKCDNLMKQFNKSLNRNNENVEKSPIIETPQKSTVNKEDDLYKHNDIVDKLSDQLCEVLNKDDSPVPDEQIDELNVPMPIKILRQHLTPEGKENTTSKELLGQIAKIEDQLNLNFQARKRFRKLLFPSDEDLNNICDVSDFPTQTKDSDSSIKSSNSMTFQTSNVYLEDDDMELHSSIACTGMTKSEAKILKSSIHTLGKFVFHTKVKSSTTYLITKSQSINQSLDMVFAISYGCYIVSEDWVHESCKIGRWLSPQKYLISDLPEPIKDFQLRRHTTFGSTSKFNLFNKAGKIYISDECEPPAKLLKRLVHACGGHCTSTKSSANVIVGHTTPMNYNIQEKWILDCITQGILLNRYQYEIVNATK